MSRAYGSQIAGLLKHNGLKPPASGGITKQKRAYGSTVFKMTLRLIADSH